MQNNTQVRSINSVRIRIRNQARKGSIHILKHFEICRIPKSDPSTQSKHKSNMERRKVDEVCTAIFWPVPDFERKTSNSFMFSREGTFISVSLQYPTAGGFTQTVIHFLVCKHSHKYVCMRYWHMHRCVCAGVRACMRAHIPKHKWCAQTHLIQNNKQQHADTPDAK